MNKQNKHIHLCTVLCVCFVCSSEQVLKKQTHNTVYTDEQTKQTHNTDYTDEQVLFVHITQTTQMNKQNKHITQTTVLCVCFACSSV